MNCRERKAFLSLQEEKDRNEAILRRRIAKERADRKTKQIDTLFVGVAVMMSGIGAGGVCLRFDELCALGGIWFLR